MTVAYYVVLQGIDVSSATEACLRTDTNQVPLNELVPTDCEVNQTTRRWEIYGKGIFLDRCDIHYETLDFNVIMGIVGLIMFCSSSPYFEKYCVNT